MLLKERAENYGMSFPVLFTFDGLVDEDSTEPRKKWVPGQRVKITELPSPLIQPLE
ncbi:MAG: hypothetical protein NPIRA04_28350 [Nitrospirales bacterium]|nr:MAG: hypothetical protein NPIRA04_28350 [Nitrospirales bacterium]